MIQCTCVVGPVTGLLLYAKLRFRRQMHAVNIVARCPAAVAIFMPPLCLVVHPVMCFQTLPCYIGVAADSAGGVLQLRCAAAFAWSCHTRGSHMGMSEAGWGCCEMGCCSCFVGPFVGLLSCRVGLLSLLPDAGLALKAFCHRCVCATPMAGHTSHHVLLSPRVEKICYVVLMSPQARSCFRLYCCKCCVVYRMYEACLVLWFVVVAGYEAA